VSDDVTAPSREVADDAAPRLILSTPDEGIERLLAQLTVVVLRHPIAAQAAFKALVAEGRRFGETADGRRWRAALADSELVRRGRAFWEASLLNLMEDHADAVVPSGIVDAIVRSVGMGELRHLIRDATGEDVDGERRP
jgi:hypothetical protein